MSCASVAASPANAALANRADTPMRNPPVTSLISAQRPVSSSSSSQRASRAGNSALPRVESVSITAVKLNCCSAAYSMLPPPLRGRQPALAEGDCGREGGDCNAVRSDPPPPPPPPPRRGGGGASRG